MWASEEILELERQINSLPVGYVVKKKIGGKEYFYQQWKENGKTKNHLLSPEEAEVITRQIEERRELQKKLRDLRRKSPVRVQNNSEKKIADEAALGAELNFNSNAIFGEGLLRMAETASSFDKRDCFPEIPKFLYSPAEDKVCLIFGLRRTGKTTLLKQLILDMNDDDRLHTLYIKATGTDTMASLNSDLNGAKAKGFRFIFIDEVTLISDFVDNAAILSDVYAVQGIKFVLSGTDSLGFWFAQNEELYDRAVTVHTTFIPFKEHSRLLKINDIDEYIRYGGTLKAGELAFEDRDATASDASFRDDESTRRYIDTAIAQNIQHSLKCYDRGNHFRHLFELYEKNELTNAINRIIEDMNQKWTVQVITRNFKSSDLGSAADLLRKEKNPLKRTDALDSFDSSFVVKKMMKILELRNREEQSVKVKDVHIAEIKEYLKALDLIDYSYTETIPVSREREERIIFTQPGMRFCQSEVLVYSLLSDAEFGNLDSTTRDLITQKILEDVRGRMLEDIVFLETKRRLGSKSNVFKLLFASGEFDMVVQNKKTKECGVFEIKHSSEIVPAQYRHINDEEKISLTERQFGKVSRRCVIYKGKSEMLDIGIEYKNVEEFLCE